MDGRVSPVRIHRAVDPAALAEAAADFVADALRTAIESRGLARFALSGGSTPRATYEQLADAASSRGVDWSRVDAFFGDERAVPPDDAASNYRMAKESLLERVPIPPSRVHRIHGELPPADAAHRYAAVLGTDPLDVALLGMGEDGHVASLFPGTAALDSPATVLPTVAPFAPHPRITVGLSVLNASRLVVLLVAGAAKASRVEQVLQERRAGRPVLPAARVSPETGELYLFLDEAAAGLLAPRPDE